MHQSITAAYCSNLTFSSQAFWIASSIKCAAVNIMHRHTKCAHESTVDELTAQKTIWHLLRAPDHKIVLSLDWFGSHNYCWVEYSKFKAVTSLYAVLWQDQSAQLSDRSILSAAVCSNSCLFYFLLTILHDVASFFSISCLFCALEYTPVNLSQQGAHDLPLAESFLVLMILAAKSICVSLWMHFRTMEKAPLQRKRKR